MTPKEKVLAVFPESYADEVPSLISRYKSDTHFVIFANPGYNHIAIGETEDQAWEAACNVIGVKFSQHPDIDETAFNNIKRLIESGCYENFRLAHQLMIGNGFDELDSLCEIFFIMFALEYRFTKSFIVDFVWIQGMAFGVSWIHTEYICVMAYAGVWNQVYKKVMFCKRGMTPEQIRPQLIPMIKTALSKTRHIWHDKI